MQDNLKESLSPGNNLQLSSIRGTVTPHSAPLSPRKMTQQQQADRIEVEIQGLDTLPSEASPFVALLTCYISIVLCFQLPFMVCNLVFAYNEPASLCMDFGDSGLVVRNWLRGVGITEAVGCGLLVLALVATRCCSGQRGGILVLAVVALVVVGVKCLVWSIASFVLFADTIRPQCEGRIYSYGLALVIIHALTLASACCEGFRKRSG